MNNEEKLEISLDMFDSGSEIGPTLDVRCGSLTGILFTENLSNYRDCISCIHGLVRPTAFEKLAGRGASKNWRKTIRNVHTGFHLHSMIQSGQLIVLDERKRRVKRVGQKESQDEKFKRKPGRPKKVHLDSSQFGNCDNQSNTSTTTSNLSGDSHGALISDRLNDVIKRKRKKISIVASKSKYPIPQTAQQLLSAESKCNGNHVDFLKKVDESKKVIRSNRCKPIKRTRCNNFERGLNTIVSGKNAHRLNILTCVHCSAQVIDANALKYHNMLFHETLSIAKTSASEFPVQVNCCPSSGPAKEESGSFSSSVLSGNGFNSSNIGSNDLTFEQFEKFKASSSRDVEDIPGPSGFSPCHSMRAKNDGNASENSGNSLALITQLSSQYQEIKALQKETLQQTSILNSQMNELNKVVHELKSDIAGISKSLQKGQNLLLPRNGQKSSLLNGALNGILNGDKEVSKCIDDVLNVSS